MSPVAVENLRNEMRPDPVPALATQCTRIPLCEVAFRQRTMASFLASSSLQIQRTQNLERRDLGCIQNLYSLFLFSKLAAQKGKAQMETVEGFVNFVYFTNFGRENRLNRRYANMQNGLPT